MINSPDMERPHDQNRRAWDERALSGAQYATPATPEEFRNPLAIVDQCGWLGGDVTGKHLLCLAAGGGRHSALFASAGAHVTVVDISPKLLDLDRKIAAQRGLSIRVVEASMDDLSELADASFDIVVQPVSTCYVPDINLVYREVARVLVAGGVYVSQHKQPVSLQADLLPTGRGYMLNETYVRKGPLPPVMQNHQHREVGTVEYLHRWEDLIGGLCKAGFVLEDLAEPRHANLQAEPGTAGHRACFVPPFVKLKARRIPSGSTPQPRLILTR